MSLTAEYERVLMVSAAHDESVYLSDEKTTVKSNATNRYSRYYQR